MFARYTATERLSCKCGINTKLRLHFMGSEPEPMCSKCFRVFMKPWNVRNDSELEGGY